MGTQFPPTYATLVMRVLEQKLYQEIENAFGREMARQFETLWKRYLDDCFIIWTQSDEELKMFSDILNSLQTVHHGSKFSQTIIPGYYDY